MLRKAILLTGVPGVGKSTIAKRLALELGGVRVDLSELAKREGLITTYDESRKTSVVDLEGMRQRLSALTGEVDGPLILDGHQAPEVVPVEIVRLVLVLRRAPWELRDSLESRGYDPEKVRENVEAEFLDVCLADAIEALGPQLVCELDTTGKSPKEVVEEALAIVGGVEPCARGRVDWLGHPRARELLEEMDRCTS
jgi:adenylate kinase